ncbi:3D domain-containing protein [bacterium]|nr:3D domain-containing protein [bacterium]
MFRLSRKSICVFLIGAIALASVYFFLDIKKTEADFEDETVQEFPPRQVGDSLVFLQGNTLVSIKNKVIAKRMFVVVTAYSSSPDETDGTPFVTASGKYVRDGVVANNLLPFGTEIKIPELFGDKIFVVEDRMHYKKGYYHIDIWFPSKQEAQKFGAKRTYIEILEG